jgi:hypothetical protein
MLALIVLGEFSGANHYGTSLVVIALAGLFPPAP